MNFLKAASAPETSQ